MGIGTSLGAYFENDFSHQAGIEDHTHDPIERTPDQVDQNKQLEKVDNDELGGIEVSKKDKMPFPDDRNPDSTFNSRFGNLPPSGILNDLRPQDTTPPLARRIGYFKDRSQEPIDLNPMNDTENGVIGMGQTGGEGPSPAQQLLTRRSARRDVYHPDNMSDEDFYHYGVMQEPGSMSPEREARWARIDSTSPPLALGHRELQPEPTPSRDIPVLDQPGVMAEMAARLRASLGDVGSSVVDLARNEYHSNRDAVEGFSSKFKDTKAVGNDVVKEGDMSLKRTANFSIYSTNHTFNFYHEPTDTLGKLSISERNDGKQLYVHGIGLADNITPNSLGKPAMRALIRALKTEFPAAETIKGFRVSGAREQAGKTGDAEIRIRPPQPKPESKSHEDDVADYLNGALGDTNAHRY